MLSIKRKSGEYVVINGNIKVKVIKKGNNINLAIEAPKDVHIVRGELYEEENQSEK